MLTTVLGDRRGLWLECCGNRRFVPWMKGMIFLLLLPCSSSLESEGRGLRCSGFLLLGGKGLLDYSHGVLWVVLRFRPSVGLFVGLSVVLSVYLPAYLSVYLSVNLSVSRSVYWLPHPWCPVGVSRRCVQAGSLSSCSERGAFEFS